MADETAKAPVEKWKQTQEWNELLERHKKLVNNGEIALLELAPAKTHLLESGRYAAFGGFHVMGKIKDKYKNVVLDTKNLEDRISIGPFGIALKFNSEDDLRFIYAINNCPILRSKCVLEGETPLKGQHRFVIVDAEKVSAEYAAKREQDITYMNKFYSFPETVIDFLCNSAGLPTSASFPVKRADLCKAWETSTDKKATLKKLIDSPDMDFYQLAYEALQEGKKGEPNTGFYKTQSGVYKHNEEIIGNSLDHLVAYFKTHDEIVVALKKGLRNEIEAEKVAPKKPK